MANLSMEVKAGREQQPMVYTLELRVVLAADLAFRVEYLAHLEDLARRYGRPVSDPLHLWLCERPVEEAEPVDPPTKAEYNLLEQLLQDNRDCRVEFAAGVVRLAREYEYPLYRSLVARLWEMGGGGGGGSPRIP